MSFNMLPSDIYVHLCTIFIWIPNWNPPQKSVKMWNPQLEVLRCVNYQTNPQCFLCNLHSNPPFLLVKSIEITIEIPIKKLFSVKSPQLFKVRPLPRTSFAARILWRTSRDSTGEVLTEKKRWFLRGFPGFCKCPMADLFHITKT